MSLANGFNSPALAVHIANSLVGTGIYWLGTGDCDTPKGGKSDCAGFAINKCYNIRRHRLGFNKGPWASVEDDINCNSAIEDSQHKRELFEQALDVPKPGDLLTYPTFYIHGVPKPFIGHVTIVVAVPAEWDWHLNKWAELDVVQMCGPNGHNPGIIYSSGKHWDDHDAKWPKDEHRSKLIRVRQ